MIMARKSQILKDAGDTLGTGWRDVCGSQDWFGFLICIV